MSQDEETLQVKQNNARTEPVLFHKGNGRPKFYIYDILHAQKHDGPKGYGQDRFIARNVVFRDVMIRGVVTDCQETKNKYRLMVDDGTGAVCCFLDKGEFLEAVQRDLAKDCRSKFYLQPEMDDVSSQVSYMLLESIKRDLGTLICPYKCGDTVEIAGKLKEYNCRRYVFAKSVHKDATNDVVNDVNYRDHVNFLYCDVYPGIK